MRTARAGGPGLCDRWPVRRASREASDGGVGRAWAWLLVAPGAAWALAGAWAALGIAWGLGDRFLHDEGLLAWCFARMVGDEPAAVLFWQKSRPVLALWQAPVAALGYQAQIVAHVVVAALAIPLVAAVARALGQRLPNLAGLVVALSPLWLACAAAGVSNSDATTGLALALFLWKVRGRPGLAGALLGALLLVRSEVAVFVGGLGLAALCGGPRRLWLAAPTVPLLYAIAGAIYHRDALWMLHYPPALPSPPPATPLFGEHGYAAGLAETAMALLALSPGIVLLAGLGPRRLPGFERLAMGLALCYVAAIRGMPALGIFNFDDSPRYLLPCLPFVALAIGRGLEGWPSGQDHGPWIDAALFGGLALGLAIAAEGGPAAPLWAVAAAAAMLALARAGAGRAALAGLVVAGGAGALLLLPATRLELAELRPEMMAVETWLEGHVEEARGRPLVTNLPVLKARLERRGVATGGVVFLLRADQEHEVEVLSDPANGQRAALWRALEGNFYGAPLRPGAVERSLAGREALFVLVDDPRLDSTLPPKVWWPRMEELFAAGGTTIARVRPEGGR